MKKQIILGSLIAIATITKAQNNVFPTSGNVGIGTTSPSRALEITTGAVGGGIKINRTGSAGHLALELNNATPGGRNWSFFSLGYQDGPGAGNFIIADDVANRILIKGGSGIGSGNVGIGETDPQNRLQVSTTVADDGLKIMQKSSGSAALIMNNGSSGGEQWTIKSLGYGNTEGAGNFLIGDDINRFFISGANGNVGIGTTTPGDKLQVGNSYEKIIFGSASSAALNYGTSYVGFNATKQGGNWSTSTDYSHNGGSLIYGTVFGDIVFATIPTLSNASAGQSNVSDATVWQNRRLEIKENGKIIMGSKVSSSHYNDADLKLSVDGTIACKGVYVTALSDWPDYVFAADHKLNSLDYLENYIKENKHLPNIPSAKEIAANGINVSEMSILQMEKIEELTLYIIELKKEMEILKEKVNN